MSSRTENHSEPAHSLRLLVLGLAMLLGLLPALGALADPRPKGALHLVVVSVCSTGPDTMDPEICRTTAKDLQDGFVEGFGVRPENTTVLVDETASGRNVVRTLESLAATLSVDDTLFVAVNTHGGPFETWNRAMVPDPTIRAIAGGGLAGDAYALEFWHDRPLGLPLTALENRDIVAFSDLLTAVAEIDAGVTLIIDSCYAGLAARTIDAVGRPASLELLVVSSGANQAANLNEAQTASLFTGVLADALRGGSSTILEALATATADTAAQAAEICTALGVEADIFAEILPDLPVPVSDREDGLVLLPEWYCAQTPVIYDFGASNGEAAMQ
ncbi:MAG: hypothetical protein AAGH83_08830 [Pseudomonadota bacterium]